MWRSVRDEHAAATGAAGKSAGVVHQSVDNGLAILTLNRPDRMNAINSEMATALNEALTAISIDKNIHAVIITGAGKGFCAGGDLKVICGSAAKKRQRISGAAAARRAWATY